MPKIWKFRDSTTNVAQIPTSFYDVIKNKKKFICFEIEIAFFTWNRLFCPLRMKHWCLKFITYYLSEWDTFKIYNIVSFKIRIWQSLIACSFFCVYVYLFEVTWLFTWASVIHMDFEMHTRMKFWRFPIMIDV